MISTQKKRKKKYIVNVIVFTLSLLMALIVAEFVARYIQPKGTPVIRNVYERENFFQFDDVLGWNNGSNRVNHQETVEFSIDININAHGMRYRQVTMEPDATKTRIAVLGDSFLWGIGVKEEERFTELVEKAGNGKYELLNFGVVGYGPIQYYLKLEHVLKFKPKVVLINFFLGNDFVDNVLWRRYWHYFKPYALEAADGRFSINGYPLPRSPVFSKFATSPVVYWLSDHSTLFNLIYITYLRTFWLTLESQAGLKGIDPQQKDFYYSNDANSSKVERTVDITKRILRAIRDKLRENHIAFAVIVASSKCEYQACISDEANPPLNKVRNYLLEILDDLDIQALDQTDEITLEDFWSHDNSHWRPSAHIKVAKSVYEWLKKIDHPATDTIIPQ